MRKLTLTVAVVCLIGAMTLPSCIGSFSLTNKLLTWNRQVGSKFVNELVFFAFWILPVYEVSGLADLLVLNSIEFWSGTNPVEAGTHTIKGNDGEYLVTVDKKGYTIKSKNDGSEVRLNYKKKENAWAMQMPDGTEQIIFSFVDDTHIALPTPDGQSTIVELSDAGLYAYSQIATGSAFAKR
ncbi:DUF3332 domain-containing protein [uncultured Duncaniella sp.]|uniref:DUF3332 domain-containing protein n=1 Tax=uncultured Duncaniella sp. TaxID=2768039 RepID=UPI00265F7F10|nr:DUF3332 domain-containing protein [uncultured Duncaniella sp.]